MKDISIVYSSCKLLFLFQPAKTIRSGQCSRINTGAPLPPGADAVVMVEETELVESKQDVRFIELLSIQDKNCTNSTVQ